MKFKRGFTNWFFVAGVLVLGVLFWLGGQAFQAGRSNAFDGERAYKDVAYQVSLGPRTPDSPAHAQVVQWITAELKTAKWEVDVQKSSRMGHPVENIIARRGTGRPWVILGAHYDSRIKADQDPDPAKRVEPVPAANDGASGVAVLNELARSLPEDLSGQVWLVYIDVEDNGDLPGWDWLLGSRAFVEGLAEKPDKAVIIDMIGDTDLNIYMERNSNKDLTKEIWDQAAELGYSKQFISTYKYSMLDDHTPFLEAGIPAIDIIDFDYPYWHTTQDTPDRVSAASLKAVGDTLRAWLTQPMQEQNP